MGVAYYIVLERDIPGQNLSVDGKALAKEEKKLKEIAHLQGVKDLMSFFSVSSCGVEDFFDEYIGMDIPETEWFSPEDGLATVRAILNYMEMKPFINNERLSDDLKSFEEILLEAQKYNLKWHLAIDI